MIMDPQQCIDRERESRRLQQCAVRAWTSGAHEVTRDGRFLLIACEKEACPSIKSAGPGAAGSTDTAEILGDDADRSTTTTFAWRAIRRAPVELQVAAQASTRPAGRAPCRRLYARMPNASHAPVITPH